MRFLSKFTDIFGPWQPRQDLDARFQRVSQLGQGTMCSLFRARDLTTGRVVVLKVLDRKKTATLLAKDPAGKKRPSEGSVAMGLIHPNLVRTFEYGISTDNEPFLVMEFLDGVGLDFLIDSKSPALKGKRINFLVQAAEGLAYFHGQNYIHRDVCPRNIMVTNEDVVKLIDFGLAVPNTPLFRRPGNRTGTATHMAPELIRRSATDQRIDVFSFGVIAYECVLCHPPWKATDSLHRLRQHLNTPPTPPKELRSDIEDEAAALLLRGIAQSPDERIPSMQAFADGLRSLRRQDY